MKIVKQGKYECAAACLAQLLDKPLFDVKRAMGRAGWRNDDSGASYEHERRAVQSFGKDLLFLGKLSTNLLLSVNKLPKAMLTIPSLNYQGKFHAVSYINGIIFDPNYEFKGRKYLSLETKISDINVLQSCILIDRIITEHEMKEIKFFRFSNTLKLIDYVIDTVV